MADFEVLVVSIDEATDHPNADRLTINTIGGYQCVSNKREDGSWRYQAGDLAVYIPEASVVPEALLKHMGFWDNDKDKGMLAGSKGNRVKAIRLRGVFSQGILMPVRTADDGNYLSFPSNDEFTSITDDCLTKAGVNVSGTLMHVAVEKGQNVADMLGITKYEPPIPTSMAGEVCNVHGLTVCFDLEHWQKYPNLFEEGEPVVFTEKLHGTFCGIAHHPELEHPDLTQLHGSWMAYSKVLGAQGLAMKDNERNQGNVYVQTLKRLLNSDHFVAGLMGLRSWGSMGLDETTPVHILGEVFGRGIQDLQYGCEDKAFRVFAVYVGTYPKGFYLDDEPLGSFLASLNVPRVPVLYRGPFSVATMEFNRDGRDFSDTHMREGLVITPIKERRHMEVERVALRCLSPDYLLRHGGTEHN